MFSLRTLPFFLALAISVSAQTPTPAVRTVSPKPAAARASYVLPGRTEPLESARVFTRATGIIQERRVDIGDSVKAGDVLAVIAAPDLDRAVEAARASVDQAGVRARNARTLATRASNLLSASAISQEDADLRASEADAAEAAVRVARADLARLEEQQRFTVVRAPFDGVVAARNLDRGDRVRGDSATAEGWLFQIVRVDTLRFSVAATPDVALRLTAETPGTLRFREFPGRAFTAKVARSSRSFDDASGTMRVELLLPNADLAVPAGLSGNATFELAPAADTYLVPTNAILTRAGTSFVNTVRDGKVRPVEIQVGRNFGNDVEVTSLELRPDSAVILNPNALLRPGDAVLIATAQKS